MLKYWDRRQKQHHLLISCKRQIGVVAMASVAPLPSLTFGSRRPLLGQGEVRILTSRIFSYY
jgi:hypothetical protein